MFNQIVVRRGTGTSATAVNVPRPRVRIAVVFIVLAAATVFPPLAAARSRASCSFHVHVHLSSPLTGRPTSGVFRAIRLGQAQCAGTLASRFVDGSGWLDASGTYSALAPTVFGDIGRCWLTSGSVSFFASPPVFPNNRRFVRMASTMRATSLAGVLMLAGSGRAGEVSLESPGSERLTYTGVGVFVPDRGQSCQHTPITSGTLTVQLVLTGPR